MNKKKEEIAIKILMWISLISFFVLMYLVNTYQLGL